MWSQFKDLCYLCLNDCVVASWSLTQEVSGSNIPFNYRMAKVYFQLCMYVCRWMIPCEYYHHSSTYPHYQSSGSLYRDTDGPAMTWTCSNLFNLDLTVQGTPDMISANSVKTIRKNSNIDYLLNNL